MIELRKPKTIALADRFGVLLSLKLDDRCGDHLIQKAQYFHSACIEEFVFFFWMNWPWSVRAMSLKKYWSPTRPPRAKNIFCKVWGRLHSPPRKPSPSHKYPTQRATESSITLWLLHRAHQWQIIDRTSCIACTWTWGLLIYWELMTRSWWVGRFWKETLSVCMGVLRLNISSGILSVARRLVI